MERTLVLIKPNATARNITGAITTVFEEAGLSVVARKRLRLSKERAQAFYAEHKERPFYNDLVAFMVSGAIEAMVLEGENAVARARDLMGATNPDDAKEGTIRARFGESIEHNAVHGSDSPASATREIAFHFADNEIGQTLVSGH